MTITEYINLNRPSSPGKKRYIQEIAADKSQWHKIPGLTSVRKVGKAYLLSIDEPAPAKE